MKCYNCQHQYNEDLINCINCNFPTADTIALFNEKPLVTAETEWFFNQNNIETEIIKEDQWYDRAIAAVCRPAKVVQLNF